MTDLAGLVRPQTIIGRLAGAKRLPFLSRTIGLSAGTTAYWRQAGVAVPVSGATFAAPTLLDRKAVHAMLVTTDEFLRESSPIAERALVADLVRAIAVAIDAALLDPSNSGDDSTPAAITTTGSVASTGSTLAQIDADLRGAAEELASSGADMMSAVWAMHPRTATFLAALRGTGGAPAFPDLGVNGGTVFGLPVLVSAGVPMDADTAALTQISLISADALAIADEGETSLFMSRDATIEMADDPTGSGIAPAAATKQLVSMFQSNSVAIMASSYLNWAPRRSVVAATIHDVAY